MRVRPGTLLRYYACENVLLKVIKHRSVALDVGCYDGFVLSKLETKREFLPIGIDVDEEGLKIAKERGLTCLLASGTQIPLRSESTDVVLLLDVMEHVEDDESLVEEANRILKKDAVLVLTTPIAGKKVFPFADMEKIHMSRGHVREGYSYQELSRLLESNHFEPLESKTISNFLSRFARVFLFSLFRFPSYRCRLFIYSLILRAEGKIRAGGFEHLIICARR